MYSVVQDESCNRERHTGNFVLQIDRKSLCDMCTINVFSKVDNKDDLIAILAKGAMLSVGSLYLPNDVWLNLYAYLNRL